MPKLWNRTITQHRRQVSESILETAAELVQARGLRGVTMSEIAHETGIGRATLYKYFPDVEAILVAWHEQQVAGHLAKVADARDHTAGGPAEQLEAVLSTYAALLRNARGGYDSELLALLHRGERVTEPRRHLLELIHELLVAGASSGEVRKDIPAGELAIYCLHSVGAAVDKTSRPAIRRLIQLTMDAIRPRVET